MQEVQIIADQREVVLLSWKLTQLLFGRLWENSSNLLLLLILGLKRDNLCSMMWKVRASCTSKGHTTLTTHFETIRWHFIGYLSWAQENGIHPASKNRFPGFCPKGLLGNSNAVHLNFKKIQRIACNHAFCILLSLCTYLRYSPNTKWEVLLGMKSNGA